MGERVLVSVVMITYGHEKYIRQAIEGVLMQQGDFDLELVIANDCSPDNTDAVVQDVLSHHSNAHWIRYVRHEKNIGMMPNFIFALQQAKGKYTALCEGDDYWTDPFKLQKQVDFLEANLEYVLSFHKIKILNPNGELVDDFITKVPENYETQESLARLGNYIHTPSVVFRNVIKEYPFEFFLSPVGDYFLYILLSEHGKLKYLEEEMAVYRYGVGVHSSKSRLDMTKTVFNFYSLLLSYSNNSKINEIILERHANNFKSLEMIIRNEYNESFVSNHLFFKAIKTINKPKVFWKKLKQKITFKKK